MASVDGGIVDHQYGRAFQGEYKAVNTGHHRGETGFVKINQVDLLLLGLFCQCRQLLLGLGEQIGGTFGF